MATKIHQSAKQITDEYVASFSATMQSKLHEADTLHDELVEQAMSSIYDATQEALDHIMDHQLQATTPIDPVPSPHPDAAPSTMEYASGDVRNHSTSATKPSRPGLLPTPWSRNRPTGAASTKPGTSDSAPRPTATPPPEPFFHSYYDKPHEEPTADIIPTSPTLQLDHHKFIKYVEVTY